MKNLLLLIPLLLITVIYADGQWQTNGGIVYYNNGPVGIGTNNPVKPLHIANTAGNADFNLCVSGSGPSVLFSATHTFPITMYGKIALATATAQYTNTSTAGDFVLCSCTLNKSLLFLTTDNPNNAGIERMRIAGNGNLGIGTITPSARLHNNGSVRFENLPTGIGNVLVIDANGNVFRSAQLARVVSTDTDKDAELRELKEKVTKLEQEIQNLQLLVSRGRSHTN
ncbi:MAG TPA: hypothetical protein VM802_00750 [Chitinophaga sp.]|uniref:hypothetical protein n=1 Tax=Chitinophaga sp. TaxID=1869181 RepID=UPI002C441F1D|nr:hypothetical protein [Chitinophaga sp.]HVI43359.1 hypothetical protein [Chitinophaga sp.]